MLFAHWQAWLRLQPPGECRGVDGKMEPLFYGLAIGQSPAAHGPQGQACQRKGQIGNRARLGDRLDVELHPDGVSCLEIGANLKLNDIAGVVRVGKAEGSAGVRCQGGPGQEGG